MLAANWKGLQLVWDLGYMSIIMKSNAHEALNLTIDTQQTDFHPHTTLLSLIRMLASLPYVISFIHILREGNDHAEWLAKFGVTIIPRAW